MSIQSDKVKKWRKATKQKMIDSMGGKCQCCGYNICTEALEFHHLNPEEKEFGFGKVIANPKEWSQIVAELKKCILVCANCHREIHAEKRDVPNEFSKFDESFDEHKISFISHCPICGEEKEEKYKTCSRSCAAKLGSNQKFDWSVVELEDMYVKQKIPVIKIGEMLGVSDAAVHKRLKKIGLK